MANLPKKGPGRPRGSQNRVGKEVKQIIAAAAEELGGQARLVEWAKSNSENESAFWRAIYPKLLPLQVYSDPDAPLLSGITVTLVNSANRNT